MQCNNILRYEGNGYNHLQPEHELDLLALAAFAGQAGPNVEILSLDFPHKRVE